MTEQLQRALSPVRSRQRMVVVVRLMFGGLFVSAGLAVSLELLRRVLGWWYSPVPGLVTVLAGPMVGLLVGIFRESTWSVAAEAVDRHYGLKDRTISALSFGRSDDGSTLTALAIEDAERHLMQLDPRAVAPMRLPAVWWVASALFVCALMVVMRPSPRPLGVTRGATIPGLASEAEEMVAHYRELEEFAANFDDPMARELAEQLRAAAEEMAQPDVDIREAMAKLSEMQEMLAQRQAAFDLPLVDAQLSALGKAMSMTDALRAAGEALGQKDFVKAADELSQLESIPSSTMTGEQLEAIAKKMAELGLSELGDATQQLANAMMGQSDDAGAAATKLAELVKQHGERSEMNQWMSREISRIDEIKAEVIAMGAQGDPQNVSSSGMSQGQATSRSNSTNPSDQPGQSWGAGATGNPMAEPTSLDGVRKMEQVAGEVGEGGFETETTHTGESEHLAGRAYRESFQKYEKLAESVLESEPIPLGHRQTIRRYFESIRPAGQDE